MLYRKKFSAVALVILPFLLSVHSSASPASAPAVVKVMINVTDAPRKIFHTHMLMPVKAGPLTLLYPEWIPGEHGPTGPLVNIAGLKITAGGRDIAWRRDLINMYSIHLRVPHGVTVLQIDFDFLSPVKTGDFTAGVSATPNLVDLNWNQVTLYQAGYPASALVYQPSVKLPHGWKFATALRVDARRGNLITFKPVAYNHLVDSPLIAGRYFKRVELVSGKSRAENLNLISDNPADLAITHDQVEHYRNLTIQAHRLFGAQHFNHYDFLYTLSDNTAHFGLEHHQSSDDRTGVNTLTDADARLAHAGLLPHEYVHSWNGKFRRPADLATSNFDQPMKTDLLWVYEGLTEYLGNVLTARSGLWTAQQYRDALAATAAYMDYRPGRLWRPLQDTADQAQILYGSSRAWGNWRRRTDFYAEGELLWLDVDTRIRELSHGKRSLNDFCRLFFGIRDGDFHVDPYTFDDITATLNKVQAYNWSDFLQDLLNRKQYHAPLDGITHGGWKLVYNAQPSMYFKASSKVRKIVNMMYSIGIILGHHNRIEEVLWNGPAFKAGVGVGMRLIAVNGRQYTPRVLKQAIKSARDNRRESIDLLVKNQDMYKTVQVDYHGGLRYPHLQRNPGVPDRLDKIITALPKSM